MLVDRNYIFTLYQMGAGAVFRYLQQIEHRVEDAEARVARSQQAQVDKLSKELTLTKRTLARKSQQLIHERQLNHQLIRRIRELEHEFERGTTTVERDSHNSSMPPSLDLPWQKPKRTRSLRKKTGLKVGGQHGHPGATLRQVAQPDLIIIHAPEVCASCATPLEQTVVARRQRRQVFDLCDGRMKVTEHQAETRHCNICGARVKATFPASVRAPVQYGQGVLSRSTYLHLYQLIPVARTSETMRDLVFVEEASPEQKVWTTPLAKLLLKIKDAVAEAKTDHEEGLSEQIKSGFLRRYDKLVKKADRLNPPPPKRKVEGDSPKKRFIQQPTPRTLTNRLQRKRDEVLRCMSDLSVPFDNNGSERDLRMVKLQQKISGCFRTPDGARNFCRVRSYLSTTRKPGQSLLCALERVFNGKPLVFQ